MAPKRKVYLSFLAAPASETSMSAAPIAAAKAEFARRLQQRMVEEGWNQSELSRRASMHLDAPMGRDNVSGYVRGLHMPGPLHLAALAKALRCQPQDLLPARGVPSAADHNPPLDVRDAGEGNAWLHINQAVPWEKALKIMALLKG